MTRTALRWRTVPAIILAASCGPSPDVSLEQVFTRYREAADRHDLAQIRAMIAEDAIWYLGPDTLVGSDAILRPHEFDRGARTNVRVDRVSVSGDTVSFDITERNDVLTALGVPILHHRGRMIIKDGLIRRIAPRGPPLELAAFTDSVAAFRQWLRVNNPAAYDQLWPGGKFNYSHATGEQMPALAAEWKRRR